MRWFVLISLTVMSAGAVGCKEVEHYPVRPGGGGPNSGGVINDGQDAGYGGGDGGVGSRIAGRVCRIVDLRYPATCAPSPDMSGIVVASRYGTAEATTSRTGDFVLYTAPSSSVVLDVGFGNDYYVPSIVPLGYKDPEDVIVPLVDAAAWQTLVYSLDVAVPDGTGMIVAYLEYQGEPMPGGQIVDVSSSSAIYYDNGGVYSWTPDGVTAAAGVALIVGVYEPAAELTALDVVTNSYRVAEGIPISESAITFVTVDLAY